MTATESINEMASKLKAAGIRQLAWAKESGVSVPTIWRLRNGRGSLTDTYGKLCEAYARMMGE